MKNKDEKILCKAELRYCSTAMSKIMTLIWYAAAAFILWTTGSGQNWRLFKSFWGISYADSSVPLVKSVPEICIVVLITAVPVIIRKIRKFKVKRCTLILTEKQIRGSAWKPFSSKKFSIPIEKIDSIVLTGRFIDLLRYGMSSEWINFRYVRNADEFVQAANDRIAEIKRDMPCGEISVSARHNGRHLRKKQ